MEAFNHVIGTEIIANA